MPCSIFARASLENLMLLAVMVALLGKATHRRPFNCENATFRLDDGQFIVGRAFLDDRQGAA
jgi:hypothetical protein